MYRQIAATRILVYTRYSIDGRHHQILLSSTTAEDAYFIAKYGGIDQNEFQCSGAAVSIEYRLPPKGPMRSHARFS